MFKIIGLIPHYPDAVKKKPIVNTPILDIRARMKEFKDDSTFTFPKFICYNFNVLTPVQDQGSICGSCWAFVTAGVIGDKISVYKNKPVLMSAQALLQCYDREKACKGAAPEKVFEWMEKTNYKLPFDFELRYKQLRSSNIKGECPALPGINVKQDSLKRLTDPLPYKVFLQTGKASDEQKRILDRNIKNMKRELIENGPFFATIIVYDDLFTYNDGRYYSSNYKGTPAGGHAIEIVGYCDEGEDPRAGYKAGYWICKNTWGVLWPLKSKTPGYFAVRMGVNMCGIESRCGTIDPNITMDSIKPDAVYTNFTKYAAEFLA